MASAGTVVELRARALGAALADGVEDTTPPRRSQVSAYDRFRLHQIAAAELAACDAGDLREALRLSELYEREEAKALGLTKRGGSR